MGIFGKRTQKVNKRVTLKAQMKVRNSSRACYDCRHFFRSQVRSWMIKEKQIDIKEIKEIMGHILQVHEKYGGESPFEYKLEIVDSVFG